MKDPERPKRPAGPYLRFVAEYRSKQSGMPGKEVLSKAATEWKALSASEKKVYEVPYEAELEVYKAAFEAYESSGKKDAWDRDPEKPKLPQTGWMRFLAEFRTRRSDLKMTEQSQEAGKEWKAMTPEQQRPYSEKYAEEKRSYDTAMAEYKVSGKAEAWEERVGFGAAKRKEAEKNQAAKDKLAKEKEKEKAAAARRAAKEKEKKKAAAAKEKQKEKAAKAKEKEKAAKAAAKEKEKAAKAKAKAKAEKVKK